MRAGPDRENFWAFWAQLEVTRPGPVPLEGETVSHDSVVDAVHAPPRHAQGEPMTATGVEPVEVVALADGGSIENLVRVTKGSPPTAVRVVMGTYAPSPVLCPGMPPSFTTP